MRILSLIAHCLNSVYQCTQPTPIASYFHSITLHLATFLLMPSSFSRNNIKICVFTSIIKISTQYCWMNSSKMVMNVWQFIFNEIRRMRVCTQLTLDTDQRLMPNIVSQQQREVSYYESIEREKLGTAMVWWQYSSQFIFTLSNVATE